MVERKLFSKKDLFFIFAIIIILVAIYFLSSSPKDTDTVVVRITGNIAYEFTKPGEYDIMSSGKNIMKLHFDGKKIWVTEAT